MNSGRFVWAAGALGLLLGCSGRFDVGIIPDGAGNGGSSGTSGGSTAAGNTATGGAFAGSSGDEPSYCGVALPAAHSAEFATPEVVWARVQMFLLGEVGTPPALPAMTTREWAGEQAMNTLDGVAPSAAPGLERFVQSWLPGSKQPTLWAGILGSSSATLTDLLTTDVGTPSGAGVLTDRVVLELPNLARRGAYLRQNLTCTNVPPPPPNVPGLDTRGPGVTRRAQFEAHRAHPACAACHVQIDPLGIALEHFTPVTGVYSDLDNGVPVDSSTSFTLPISGEFHFADAQELGAGLAGSCEVAQCLTRRLLEDAESSAQLPLPGSADPALVAELAYASYQSGYNLRGLIWNIVQSDTFLRAP